MCMHRDPKFPGQNQSVYNILHKNLNASLPLPDFVGLLILYMDALTFYLIFHLASETPQSSRMRFLLYLMLF